MSRAEHETHTAKLQRYVHVRVFGLLTFALTRHIPIHRTRTQAKARSDTIRRPAGEAPSQGEVQRKTTMRRAQQAAGGDYNPAASTSSQRPYPPPQQQLSQSPPSTVSSPANLGPPRAGPEMKRFTLTDAPPAPGSMPPPSRPQPQRPPPQQQQAPVPVNTAAQKEKGPETFEQMGIQTTTMKKVSGRGMCVKTRFADRLICRTIASFANDHPCTHHTLPAKMSLTLDTHTSLSAASSSSSLFFSLAFAYCCRRLSV